MRVQRFHGRRLTAAAMFVLSGICAALVAGGSPHAADETANDAAPLAAIEPSPVGPKSWATFRNGLPQLGIAGSGLPEKPEVLWTKKSPDGVVAGAAIVGEQVYVPCLNGTLLSIERRTGAIQWSYRSLETKDPNEFAPGFKAAPTVANDAVYLGDEDGVLHAVDRTNGRRRWSFRAGGEIAGSVAVLDDKIVMGSHDHHLYCLKTDGSLVWKFATENMVNCSSAVVENFTFVAGCDTKIRVIDIREGKQVKEVPLGEGAFLIASPAVRDEMLYVGTHDGRVVGVDWKNEKVVWTYTNPQKQMEYRASAAVTENAVLVGGHDRLLHCLDRKTGEVIWDFPTKGQIESSPVVVGDRVVFGSSDGNVYAVTLKDGKEVWKHRCGRSVIASPAVGENCLVIGADGTNGAIFCFGAKGGQLRLALIALFRKDEEPEE